MTPAQAWRLLGIAPTDDARAVRRAYAARLKALDVDADPAGFEALQAARQQALWVAEHALHESDWNLTDEPEEDDQDADVSFDQDEDAPFDQDGDDAPYDASDAWEEPLAPPAVSPAAAADDAYELHAAALHRLLHADGDIATPLDDRELLAARVELQALLADPRLVAIDRHSDLERWLAMLLGETIPRADPLLDEAARFFGWRARAGRVEESWWIREVNDRIDALELRAKLVGGGHEWSGAWRELTRPVSPRGTVRRGFFVRRKPVKDLLLAVQTQYPTLERELQPQRVGVWEDAPALGCSTPGVLLIIAIQLILAIARCDPAPDQTAPLPIAVQTIPLSDADSDIQRVLLGSFGPGVDEATLRAKQPELAQLLRTNWSIAHEADRSRDQFESEMRALIEARARRMRPKPGSELMELVQRNRLAILVDLSATPADCVAFLRGQLRDVDRIPKSLRDMARALQRQAVLEGVLQAEDAPRTFTIPGEVIERVLDRSGLSETRVRAALRGDGSAADVCRTEIVLRRVAEDLPARQRYALQANL